MHVLEKKLVPCLPSPRALTPSQASLYIPERQGGHLGACWLTNKSLGFPQLLGIETCFVCGRGFRPKVSLTQSGQCGLGKERFRYHILKTAFPGQA